MAARWGLALLARGGLGALLLWSLAACGGGGQGVGSSGANEDGADAAGAADTVALGDALGAGEDAGSSACGRVADALAGCMAQLCPNAAEDEDALRDVLTLMCREDEAHLSEIAAGDCTAAGYAALLGPGAPFQSLCEDGPYLATVNCARLMVLRRACPEPGEPDGGAPETFRLYVCAMGTPGEQAIDCALQAGEGYAASGDTADCDGFWACFR